MPSARYTLFSPAKINLFLEIAGRRADGYHDLLTLFAKTSFGDSIDLKITPAAQTRISLKITPQTAGLKEDSSNLAWRAAEIFLNTFNKTAEVEISLNKKIPLGAGLGGGSSNAGVILKALGAHFGVGTKDLVPIASKLGADVALFLYDEPLLKGLGIGDVLTPLKAPALPQHIVIAYPRQNIPTKNVFANIRVPAQTEILTSMSNLDRICMLIEGRARLTQWGGLLFNRLEEGVLPFYKKVSALKDSMQGDGHYTLMSGSGSSVFALFETESGAHQLAQRIHDAYVIQTKFGGNNEDN